jgi:60 kDa SS-A/Ro ribonucleoprotein
MEKIGRRCVMPANPLRAFSTRATRQSEPIPASDQVANSAGGHAWPVNDWTRLRRFLILGVDGDSYYARAQELVRDNAEAVLRCAALDGRRTVDEIVAISEEGRNPRQQPVQFALAICASADDPETRAYALSAVARVCRTGTQLFLFAGYAEQFRGWGRGLRRAIADWYLDRDVDSLALQLVKYQRREGWTHRDLLRLAKPRPERDSARDVALGWAVGKLDGELPEHAPALLHAHAAAQRATSPAETAALITDHQLPWEAVSSAHLRDPAVWIASLPTMGLGALVRNLGRMTAIEAITPGSDSVRVVVDRLGNVDAIRRARIHPIQILSALLTYRNGRGVRGRLAWEPVPAIIDALDAAFYASFATVDASGTRMLAALDVSGSMGHGSIAGVPGLTPRLGSAAMVAVALATEPEVHTVAFTSAGRRAWSAPSERKRFSVPDGIAPLPISTRQRLDDIVKTVSGLPFGGTDCALPMLYALDRRLEIDTFIIYTDSETWAGDIHPAQALARYRERTGIPARLIVVGMVSNGFSIADPQDGGMLDVVGFDTAAPQVMADFAAGRI